MSDETKKDGVNLSDTEKKLDQADSIITKTWNILKNHWGKLIVFLLIYGGYKFVVLVGEEMDKANQQEQAQPLIENTIPIQQEQAQPYIENITPIQQEQAQPYIENITPIQPGPYIINEYDELQEDGSYLRIIVWSTGEETVDANYKYEY